jgi:hypothetical protein
LEFSNKSEADVIILLINDGRGYGRVRDDGRAHHDDLRAF